MKDPEEATKNEERIERVLSESGKPADAAEEEPLSAVPAPDRTKQFLHANFSRVRRDWPDADKMTLAELNALASDIMKDRFRVAFAIIERIHRYVRIPVADENGEVLTYPDGTPRWETDEFGVPAEDWSQLGSTERERLLHTIAVYLFEWEQAAAAIWSDAMYAKVIWEETFAKGFTALPGVAISGKPTIDDRTQWGHRMAIEDRYFAVFRSSLSRQADALVRSMNRIYRTLENAQSR